jgi:hypothetical protein
MAKGMVSFERSASTKLAERKTRVMVSRLFLTDDALCVSIMCRMN